MGSAASSPRNVISTLGSLYGGTSKPLHSRAQSVDGASVARAAVETVDRRNRPVSVLAPVHVPRYLAGAETAKHLQQDGKRGHVSRHDLALRSDQYRCVEYGLGAGR